MSPGLPAGPLGLLGLSEGLSYLAAPRSVRSSVLGPVIVTGWGRAVPCSFLANEAQNISELLERFVSVYVCGWLSIGASSHKGGSMQQRNNMHTCTVLIHIHYFPMNQALGLLLATAAAGLRSGRSLSRDGVKFVPPAKPSGPSLPKISMPNVEIPKVSLPAAPSLPKVQRSVARGVACERHIQ